MAPLDHQGPTGPRYRPLPRLRPGREQGQRTSAWWPPYLELQFAFDASGVARRKTVALGRFPDCPSCPDAQHPDGGDEVPPTRNDWDRLVIASYREAIAARPN